MRENATNMKTKTISIGITVFLYTFFHISATRAETLPPIIISEIQITGGDGHTNNEFIRLSAADSDPVTLTGFKIIQTKFSEKKSICSDETLVPTGKFAAKSIPGNGSLLIAHPEYEGTDVVDIFYAKSNTLTESTMRISLLDESGNLITKKDVGTRCEAEQQTDPIPPGISDVPPATDSGIKTVRLNEIFPNPSAKGDTGEFIELYNSGHDPIDLSDWTILDAAALKKKSGGATVPASAKITFPSGTTIEAGGYSLITDTANGFHLSINNTNETLTLFDKQGTLIDSMSFVKSAENVSLNYTPAGWRGGAPTPGSANRLNSLPATDEKVPKKGYKGMPIGFSAKGSDADGDTLKYTWDFGDGHKSYKEKTSHTYEENGAYTVTLKTTDSKEDILETFIIEITSYSRPKIRITSLVPNPEGRDTDNEWVMLENREKKTINLKGFGIATGWKNLVNHPIREDFFIGPKQGRRLTRAHSLFTLPNQKGKIELRAPDGKVVQKIKYKLEKSAAEDIVYSKAKGRRWEWHEEKPTEEKEEKESLAVSDTDENAVVAEEETPLEEAVPPIEESAKKQVLGAKTSHADDSEKFMPLLNYGTRVKIPSNISLAFDETDDVPPLLSQEHYAISFAKESLSELNAALNELLHNAR